jgi:hypothetical protein
LELPKNIIEEIFTDFSPPPTPPQRKKKKKISAYSMKNKEINKQE